MAERAQQHMGVAMTLPLGKCVPCGTVRWYFVHCYEGQELKACADVRKLVPHDLLQDCFVPRKQCLDERSGSQKTTLVPLYKGYFVAATADAPALANKLALLTVPVQLVGKVGSGYAPVAEEAQEFLSAVMDRGHVIRASRAVADNNGVRITSGPLMGQEHRIRTYDSRKLSARVTVCEDVRGGESFSVTVPMDVQTATVAQNVEEPWRPATAPAKSAAHTSLPLGRRTPRGRLRWYLVECPEHTEAQMCEALRNVVPAHLLADAYVPKVERIKKVKGEWTKPVQSLVLGRFAVATTDSAALNIAISQSGLPLQLVGQGRDFQPLDDDAWGLVGSLMDGTHTIRESQGEIVGNVV